MLALILFIRNVQGGLLISILVGTSLAYVLGAVNPGESVSAMDALRQYGGLFGELSLMKLADVAFWIAVFLLLLIVVFENIGLITAQTQMIGRPERFKGSLRALSISTVLAGIFGSSPPVAAAETTAGIAAGGRTGLTPLVTAVLFGATFSSSRSSVTFRTVQLRPF